MGRSRVPSCSPTASLRSANQGTLICATIRGTRVPAIHRSVHVTSPRRDAVLEILIGIIGWWSGVLPWPVALVFGVVGVVDILVQS